MNTYYFFIYLMIFLSIGLMTYTILKIGYREMSDYRDQVITGYSLTLTELFIFMEPEKLWKYNFFLVILVTLLGGIIYSISGMIIYIPVFAIFGVIVPRIWIFWIKKQRFKKFDEQLTDGLTVMSNALRAGQNLSLAIKTLVNEMGPPISQEFALVHMQTKIGIPMKKALENLSKRVLDEDLKINEDLKLVVTCVNIVEKMGGNLTVVFDTITDLIRNRKIIQKKIKSLTALGKFQGLVATLLPMIVGIIMYCFDHDSMILMFRTDIGLSILFLMIVMQTIGFFLIRKIVDIKI